MFYLSKMIHVRTQIFVVLLLAQTASFKRYEGETCAIGNTIGECCLLSGCSTFMCDFQGEDLYEDLSCSFAECEEYDGLPRFKRENFYYYYNGQDDQQTSPADTRSPSDQLLVDTNDNDTTTMSTPPAPVYAAVGGTDAFIYEFPHMAAMGWPLRNGGFSFKCGGSLISERFVLTAGHCLSLARDTTLASNEPTLVRLGDQNILDIIPDGAEPLDVPILRIIRHPSYKPPKKYFDIALLELQSTVPISDHIKPACLWTKPDFKYYSTATVTGWGTTVSGGRDNSAILQKVDVDILETRLCQHLLKHSHNRNWQGFSEHQLCAGVLEGGKDACQGDSGGPLQVKARDQLMRYYLIGVTSFGRECGKPNLPGVYTRVSSFVEWIESVVWP